MLQKLAHRSHGLHKREKLEVAQSDVDATKLTYHVRQGTNDTDWLPSKILVDLGHIEVLKLPPGAIVPSAAIVPAEMPPRRYLQYLSWLSSIWKACSGDPVISARLGKDLVKWVVVEKIL
jgi:hypothetical protein